MANPEAINLEKTHKVAGLTGMIHVRGFLITKGLAPPFGCFFLDFLGIQKTGVEVHPL